MADETRAMNQVVHHCPHRERKEAQDIKDLLNENHIECRIENAEGEWLICVYPEDLEKTRGVINRFIDEQGSEEEAELRILELCDDRDEW